MKKLSNRYINGVRNDYVPGSVYIFKDTKGFYKIGLTGREIHLRKRELEEDWGKLELVELVHTSSMRALEDKMHNHFRRFNVYMGRKSGGTEFFRLPYFEQWKARYLLHCWSESNKPLWFYFYFVGSWIKYAFTQLWKIARKKK
jgi:hypothetical protein